MRDRAGRENVSGLVVRGSKEGKPCAEFERQSSLTRRSRRVAVQIDYNDWLRIERSLNLQDDRNRRSVSLRWGDLSDRRATGLPSAHPERVVLKKVLDTNAILYLLGGKLAQPLPTGAYFVSVISEMELLSYPSLDEAALNQNRAVLSDVTVVELSEQVRELAIGLRRRHMLKLPDAIVAATALSLQTQLITNDVKLLRVPNLACERLELKEGQ